MKSQTIYQILIKNEQQFKVLYNLKLNKPVNKVFYAAPIFHKLTDMKRFYLKKTIEENTALFPLEMFPPPKDGGYHELKYEYSMINASQNAVALTNLKVKPKGTYGVLNSDPMSIETLHGVFSDSDKRDVMPLVKKAEFILKVCYTMRCCA